MSVNDIRQNIRRVKETLPDDVCLVAISKFHSNESLLAAYSEGQRIFGESREQELSKKHESLPDDIQWHFIGHLQTNKVRFIAPYISLIHAVDSLKLMKEIDRQAAKNNRTIDILLEIHIAEEETKSGFTIEECRSMLSDGEWRELEHVRICGLMTMASFVDDTEQIRREFMLASDLFDEIKADYFSNADYFATKSWGMSDDYHIAIECGSNMVRIGTTIFGPREY